VVVFASRWRGLSPKPTAMAVLASQGRLVSVAIRAAGLDIQDVTSRMPETNRLSVALAHPTFMVDTLLQNLPRTDAIALMEANNHMRNQYLRVNTLKADVAETLLNLYELGVELVEDQDTPGVFAITSGFGALVTSELFEKGSVLVQDKSSVLTVQALGLTSDDIVWDACAAPGMKTHRIEELMNSRRAIYATDIHEGRLATAKERSRILGMSCTQWIHADAITCPVTNASKILIDAPCSSSGLIRSHPSFKWRLNKQSLMSLMAIQNKILDGILSGYSELPGTELVYATCSILPHEGESQIDSAMTRHDFALLDLPFESSGGYPGFRCSDKVRRLFPHKDRTNGFFMARLRITD
ncbi:MAG: RsmB/NOP family class I SAM-dependent RNA methyltransferase, partial [Gammaproteobacteria bacterium]|nr:RsmB/NOP family class I SAM-dependent RNA methyltransferase [Gammaproteobacteria bacterium]